MEVYKININSPRMEPRILLSTVDFTGDLFATSYTEANGEEYISFNVTDEAKRGINVGDILYFRKKLNDVVYAELPVTIRAITNEGIVTTVPGKDEIVSITGAEIDEGETCTATTIYLDNDYCFLPEDYNKLNGQITATTTSFDAGTWVLSPIYKKYNTSCENNKTSETKYDYTEINTYAFGIDSMVFAEMDSDALNKIFPIVFTTSINRFFYEVNEEGGDNITIHTYQFFNNVEVIKQMAYYEIKTNINACDETNLLKENTIRDIFTNEIKNKIIPPFVDMEKIMYEPTLSSIGDTAVEEIIFNLNLRTREADKSWSIRRNGWWNEFPGGHFTSIKKADTITHLGFTDDDIRYQSMKVKKSFLRLSFYDSDNPLTQQLLYYSTIFLDSGDLFGKYIKASGTPRTDAIKCSFSVKSRYNTEKSSEGFYLYLFPSETPIDAPPKDIYMKVEFNHAGYGRTLQMLKPKIREDEWIEAIPMNEFYDYTFIKLAAKRLPGNQLNYIYYVDENTPAVDIDYDKKTINFYLFEAKVN